MSFRVKNLKACLPGATVTTTAYTDADNGGAKVSMQHTGDALEGVGVEEIAASMRRGIVRVNIVLPHARIRNDVTGRLALDGTDKPLLTGPKDGE